MYQIIRTKQRQTRTQRVTGRPNHLPAAELALAIVESLGAGGAVPDEKLVAALATSHASKAHPTPAFRREDEQGNLQGKPLCE